MITTVSSRSRVQSSRRDGRVERARCLGAPQPPLRKGSLGLSKGCIYQDTEVVTRRFSGVSRTVRPRGCGEVASQEAGEGSGADAGGPWGRTRASSLSASILGTLYMRSDYSWHL